MKNDDKIFCYKPANPNMQETSCICYINEHSIQDYMSHLILQTVRVIAEGDKSSISILESHYKHLYSFWYGKAFSKQSDVTVAEILLVLLSDAIGWLRAKFEMGESPVIKECLKMAELLEKNDLELTDKEFEILLKTNNVYHRKCDICGCDLAIPNRGVFSRKAIQTVACESCTNTKAHNDLLMYIEKLKKKHDKATIIEILDNRMDETWGQGETFTVKEWNDYNKQ